MTAALTISRCALVIAATAIAVASAHAREPDAARRQLGEALFFDQRLSADGTIACANCHNPTIAYADARAVARGHAGATGARNTPSLLNASAYTRWGWDGRNTSLATQAVEPLLSSTEHGFTDAREFLSALKAIPERAQQYRSAFGADAPFTMQNVGAALEAFVRSLPGEVTHAPASNAQIEHGKRLFAGKAACNQCHQPAAGFTDNQFHLGYQGVVSIDAAIQATMNRLRLRTLTSHYRRAASDPVTARLGAFIATLDPADVGKFRTPSLMHVAQTAPYMHDGSVTTLREAVAIELRTRGVTLAEPEQEALLAYLNTLGSNSASTTFARR
jgi:cytochrome c peroxidase